MQAAISEKGSHMMHITLDMGAGALSFVLYWCLTSRLVGAVLEAPRLKPKNWIWLGMLNTCIVFLASILNYNVFLLFFIMMGLMLLEFNFFYKDSLSGSVFCTLACFIHILSVFTITIGIYSIRTGNLPFEILHDKRLFLHCVIISFSLLDALILGVIKLVPLPMVRLINRHSEQKYFIIVWMAVNSIFLLYFAEYFNRPDYPVHLSYCQMAASAVSLTSLYIVLFFSIKTSAILGYKEINVKLEQEIHQQQLYHNSMVKDSIASYEVNVTRDEIIKGLEDRQGEMDEVSQCYSDMLAYLSGKLIYSEDVAEFIRNHARENILRSHERGKNEITAEYRRLLENGKYIWVRAIIHLAADMDTGDIKAFVCVKDIDAEKKKQIELQYKAERDSLTGLYNKSMTGKLVDEYLMFGQSHGNSALFMIDLDDFKDINDHFGHVYGDALLCELADKLVGMSGSSDIVGRIGGDEFILFMKKGATEDKVEEKAVEICRDFQVLCKGMNGTQYEVSSSIGISFFPEDGENFKDLYEHADAALYAAKSGGKKRYRIYDGSIFTGYTSKRTKIQTAGSLSQKGFRQNRIEYVFKILYQSENSVAAIHSALELAARHFYFERGYIFENSKDGKTTSNTFEWCAGGVASKMENLQSLPIEAVATAVSSFEKRGAFILRSLDDLPPAERAVLEPQGIKSMFQVGIFDKSRLLGFIGFDNCKSETVPDDGEIDEMMTICNILATFFVKQYVDEVSAKDLRTRQEVMNHLDNFIYVINTETFEVLFMNEKIQNLVNEAAGGAVCYNFFRGMHQQCEDCPIRQMEANNTDRVVFELYNDKLGMWMESAASLLRWTDGSLACLISCTDITNQKDAHLRHVRQLEELVYVDELTGSRTYHKFKQDARRILENQPYVLHFLVKLDIDNFKLINQIYGYEKGNEVLCCVADAIGQTVRNEDEIFARVNSDEFIALFTLEEKGEIENLYDDFLGHFNKIMGDRFSFKFNFPHGRFLIYPGDAKKMDISDMFEKANIAHKAAKMDKTVQFAFYDERMTKDAVHVQEIENKMTKALETEEFIVYLQPKYYLTDESVGGAEALTRWKNEDGDLFFPDSFIPIFEQNGFIAKLDYYVFKKVCQMIQSWIQNGIKPVVVSVNFSRLHLGNPNFIKELCSIADDVSIPRKYLEIEITETVIYDNIDKLEILLNAIHNNGFSMSMDDFGSGYSSLGMLKNLPVDVIKMDRSFFADQRDAERSKIVVGSIIQMAAGLGIRIVAEGVEEQEHIRLLRELHCDMVQGYYYAKPMPEETFIKLLT